jgi:hypothetical protein
MKYITILALALTLGACVTTKTVKEEPFTVDLNSPRILAGMIEAQFDKIVNFAGLRTVKVTVDYYPLEDAVCLQYRLDLMTYYLFLDQEGRETYLKALQQYKEDYENRVLKPRGNKHTRRQYGKTEVYLIWQAFAFTMRSRANTTVDFGYDIKVVSDNRASFFTLYRREAYYVDVNSTEKDRKVATNEPMFFTRTQADELAALFDQDFLKSLTPDKIKVRSDSMFDSY